MFQMLWLHKNIKTFFIFYFNCSLQNPFGFCKFSPKTQDYNLKHQQNSQALVVY